MAHNFEKMKRTELQMHAKNAGIRANIKTADLIKALTAHTNKLVKSVKPTTESRSCPEVIPSSISEVIMASSDIDHTALEVMPKRSVRGRSCQGNKKEIIHKEKEIEVSDYISSVLEQLQKEDHKGIKPKRSVKPRRKSRKAAKKSIQSELEQLQKEDHKGTKPKRSVKPRRKSRTAAKRSIQSETPKSVQKRAHMESKIEAELPPAKRQHTEPAVSTSSEVVQTYRRSTRKRTFSVSPPKASTSDKENQDEESQLNEKIKKETPKTVEITVKSPLKPTAVKDTVQAKKSGIPLPKMHSLTPGKLVNFKKVHKAQFDKAESIDDYMNRKQKRIEALTNSYKKTVRNVKPVKPVSKTSQNFFSPKPKVRKSCVTKTVSFHASKLKTPSKAATFSNISEVIENRIATPGPRKSVGMNTNFTGRKSTSGATPFKFGAPSDTPSKQNKFDLEASLKKPLAYKPYTGKVKPMTEIQLQAKKPVSHIQRAKDNFKKPKVSSKQDRQRETTKKQTLTRNTNAMSRRGLPVA